jgi:arsenate reductase
VKSAGTQTEGQIHRLTREHLLVRGYSIDGLYSKGFDDVASFDPDVVVTVCDAAANDPCPVWLGSATRVHWGLKDPTAHVGSSEEVASAFNEVIDEIERRAEALSESSFEGLSDKQLEQVFRNIPLD